MTHVVHFNLLVGAAWTPWAIAFAHEAWQGRPRGALLLAVTTALLLLGAHPYAALMTLLMLGVALAYVIAAFAGWAVAWSLLVILVAVLVCVSIAVGFGVYPAVSAARMDPVLALQSD